MYEHTYLIVINNFHCLLRLLSFVELVKARACEGRGKRKTSNITLLQKYVPILSSHYVLFHHSIHFSLIYAI